MLADLFVAAAMARLIRIRSADVYSCCEMNACAETSCGHHGQEVQQFWKFSQPMEHLNGQRFH
jgi:hypothetical protein